MFEFIGTLLVGWLFADFLSGFWHWMEDRYFRTEWPVIGKYIAKPNQLHHADPTAFLNQSYWSRNWTTILPSAVTFVLLLPFAPWWVLYGIVAVSQANEIHAWSHKRSNRIVRMFQATGLLQSPRTHGQHHKSPFDIRYCVMSEWLNPILDETKFWFSLEWIVYRLLGIKAGVNND